MFNSFYIRFYILVISIGKLYASAGLEALIREACLPPPNPDTIGGILEKAFDTLF